MGIKRFFAFDLTKIIVAIVITIITAPFPLYFVLMGFALSQQRVENTIQHWGLFLVPLFVVLMLSYLLSCIIMSIVRWIGSENFKPLPNNIKLGAFIFGLYGALKFFSFLDLGSGLEHILYFLLVYIYPIFPLHLVLSLFRAVRCMFFRFCSL